LSAPVPTDSRRIQRRALRHARRRSWLGLLVPALLAFAALIALGTWQLQRKAWKEDLIATLTERLAAPPSALPAPSAWPRLDRASDEYRRVKFSAQFEPGKAALVFATTSAFRPDVSGLGFWVFAPARLADGSVVVVNRGFVPSKLADPNVHYDEADPAIVSVTGVTRWPDSRQWFTPKDKPAENVWYVRDPATIATAKNWGPVAPFYVEQELPVPQGGGWPRPGKIVVNLPNNHLQYVVTWYGLALVLVVVFAAWTLKSSREARREGAAQPPGGASPSL
jgi:surfeit locus 1 family protein